MLDILVVVILVNVMELGILAHTRFRGGVYVFAAAILVSMAATLVATRLARQGKRIALKIEHRVLHLPLVAAITPVIFIMALTSPLMRVEKWIFWENQFSVLQACRQLLARGQTVLGLCFLLFVVILPVLQQIGLLVLVVAQSLRKKGGKLVGWILQLDHWAMMDVFALAALVVVSRLGDIVRVEPQQGLKLYAVAGALSLYTSLQVHRIFRFE